MHFSAKRGIAIAYRQSVCLSVRDVGESGPHRLEIIVIINNLICIAPVCAKKTSVALADRTNYCD